MATNAAGFIVRSITSKNSFLSRSFHFFTHNNRDKTPGIQRAYCHSAGTVISLVEKGKIKKDQIEIIPGYYDADGDCTVVTDIAMNYDSFLHKQAN